MHRWMASYLPELEGRLDSFCIPAEEHSPPSDVDMVLTSPPYWGREIYCEESTQSSARYRIYAEWLDNFWRPVVRRCVEALRVGGWLVLNVDDFKLGGQEYGLVEDTVQIVSELGLDAPDRLRYDLPGGGTIKDNHESILCWCRGHRTPVAGTHSAPLTFHACSVCGNVKPFNQLRGGVCLACDAPKGTPKVCGGCGETFMARRRDQRFHTEACRARHYRREHRKLVPAKKERTFTCKSCGNQWTTEAKGSFSLCLACKEAKAKALTIKICSYRHCQKPFEDTSPKHSMSYCCPEHRRREKLFRSGIAKDESYFRSPDTVRQWRCLSCGETWTPESDEKRSNRCPDCKDRARQKLCKTCGGSFKDSSLNNTQKYCSHCG